jgi:hypothetical protein
MRRVLREVWLVLDKLAVRQELGKRCLQALVALILIH